MNKKSCWIQLKQGFSINVLSDLRQIASFIFLEQETWMEKDVSFIEALAPYLKNAIDVGANYGFYSLLMAKLGSKDICIHSIEPNSDTMNHLRRSIEEAKFDVITVHELAFSNFEGQATLTNASNPEFSELNLECRGGQPQTKVCRMDDWIQELNSSEVDFVKLDAEGSEVSIIEGGRSFFESEDPLIMFELKHVQKVQIDLLDTLKKMGYEIFQYWPGVNCLVPLDIENTKIIDTMRLNLYAAKPSRQKILNDYGLLIREFNECCNTRPQYSSSGNFHEKLNFSDENLKNWYEFSGSLSKKIFDAVLIYEEESLDLQSRVNALCKAERLVACVNSFEKLSIPDGLSLIRVLKDLGNFNNAAIVAFKILERIQAGESILIEEPFVSPGLDLEKKLLDFSIEEWLQLVLLETLESSSTFSGIFSADASLNRCDILEKFNFLNPLLNRRHVLLKKLIRGELSPLTKDSLSCSLNKGFWQNVV